MASSLITSWQIGGETMETVTDFIFLCLKIQTIFSTDSLPITLWLMPTVSVELVLNGT